MNQLKAILAQLETQLNYKSKMHGISEDKLREALIEKLKSERKEEEVEEDEENSSYQR